MLKKIRIKLLERKIAGLEARKSAAEFIISVESNDSDIAYYKVGNCEAARCQPSEHIEKEYLDCCQELGVANYDLSYLNPERFENSKEPFDATNYYAVDPVDLQLKNTKRHIHTNVKHP